MDALFFEDDLDALAATIRELGGNKKVGHALWPDKKIDTAGRLLSDCCNAGRSERLSLSQVLFIMKLARDADVHILAEYLMGEAGYARPVPLNPEAEAARLLNGLEGIVNQADRLVDKLARIKSAATQPLRAVGE
ncbi:MAG: hypothetical protein JSR41_09925 [Proteobacteria bacterium]|nr:hypothetical protein [Pseudomonadota bacterium]